MSSKNNKKLRKQYRNTMAMICTNDIVKEAELLNSRVRKSKTVKNIVLTTALIEAVVIITGVLFLILNEGF